MVRQRVFAVAGYGQFVMTDRFVDRAALEVQVAQVHQCGRIPRQNLQRLRERFTCLVDAVQGHQCDPAFVFDRGTLQRRERAIGAQFAQPVERAFVASLRDVAHRQLERRIQFGLEKSQKSAQVEHLPGMFTIDVLTLFPEVFAPFVGLSIVGRAVESGVVQIRYHHVLDALEGSERADGSPFGGGPGMVMRIEPLARILDAIAAAAPASERRLIVVPSPGGSAFDHHAARRFAEDFDRLVFVCGRYEGIDERLAALYPVHEYSLGDFVVTGGELPALAMIDATVRLLSGALRAESLADESFAGGGLDYPCYTRPPVFRGVKVPEVLLSGDHTAIARWRREQSRARTRAKRPDLPES